MSLKIGVLMGGDSEERIVSLSTGKEVLKALKKFVLIQIVPQFVLVIRRRIF